MDVDDGEEGGHTVDVRTPDGEPLDGGRRLTFRDARPWVRRTSTLVGVRSCGRPVVWAAGEDRVDLLERFRRSERGDCNLSGDVLLFRLADGRQAPVLDQT